MCLYVLGPDPSSAYVKLLVHLVAICHNWNFTSPHLHGEPYEIAIDIRFQLSLKSKVKSDFYRSSFALQQELYRVAGATVSFESGPLHVMTSSTYFDNCTGLTASIAIFEKRNTGDEIFTHTSKARSTKEC